MRRVYSDENGLRAGQVISLLEQEGIPCLLKNQFLGGARGELPVNECWPEVWVLHENDYDAAMRIIDDVILAPPVGGPGWRCACGEHIEGQFTSCWSCGCERDQVTGVQGG